MVGYGAEITHTCDNCRKLIPKWKVHQLVDRYYTPGDKFEKLSSDIKARSNKIVELCPDCMNEIYEIYDIFGKKRESNNG